MPDVLRGKGIMEFSGMQDYEDILNNMTDVTSSSVFADTHCVLVNASLARGKRIGAVLRNDTYSPNSEVNFPANEGLVNNFESIARVIKARNDPVLKAEVSHPTFEPVVLNGTRLHRACARSRS